MNKKTYAGLNIGSSSILAIFVLLCLITFSTLSLVSANADYRLSLKMSNRLLTYYEANRTAENQLGEIDGILKEVRKKSPEPESYFSSLLEKDLFPADIHTSSGSAGELFIDYSVPLNDSQILNVRLQAQYPDGVRQRSCYSVERWKLETTSEWTPDEKIKVLDPM